MSDLRIDPADARKVAGMHRQAAADINGVAGSAPGTVDGGPAGGVLLQILARIVGDADDLAKVNAACDVLMTQVAENYEVTEESVRDQFATMTAKLPTGESR